MLTISTPWFLYKLCNETGEEIFDQREPSNPRVRRCPYMRFNETIGILIKFTRINSCSSKRNHGEFVTDAGSAAGPTSVVPNPSCCCWSSTTMNETEHKRDLPWRRPCTNSTKIRIQLPVKQIVHRATSSKTNCSERSIHTVPAWEIVTGNNCIPTYSTTMTMILLFWDLKSQSSILAWAYTYICPVQSRQNTQNRKLLLTSSSKSLHSSQKY